MSDLVVAIGLVLAIEGTIYAAFPGGAKRMFRTALEAPDATLRGVGLAALAAGVLLVWLIRG